MRFRLDPTPSKTGSILIQNQRAPGDCRARERSSASASRVHQQHQVDPRAYFAIQGTETSVGIILSGGRTRTGAYMEVLDLTAFAGFLEEVARHGQAVAMYLKGTLLVVCCAATRAVLFVYDLVGLPFQLFGRCWDFAVEWVVNQVGGCFGDDDKLVVLEEGSLPNATGRDAGGNVQAMEQANAYGGHGPEDTVPPVSPGVVQANISDKNFVSGGERSSSEPQVRAGFDARPALEHGHRLPNSEPAREQT